MHWHCDDDGNCNDKCEAAQKIEGYGRTNDASKTWIDCDILQMRSCPGETCPVANITRAVMWALANEFTVEAGSSPLRADLPDRALTDVERQTRQRNVMFQHTADLLYGRTGR
jgi:hypothetical protein